VATVEASTGYNGAWYMTPKVLSWHWSSTFGRTKDPPMSLKAGKDVWLVNPRPLSFLS
jgi:hypothetical protein